MQDWIAISRESESEAYYGCAAEQDPRLRHPFPGRLFRLTTTPLTKGSYKPKVQGYEDNGRGVFARPPAGVGTYHPSKDHRFLEFDQSFVAESD